MQKLEQKPDSKKPRFWLALACRNMASAIPSLQNNEGEEHRLHLNLANMSYIYDVNETQAQAKVEQFSKALASLYSQGQQRHMK